MAEKVGISRQYYDFVENGQRRPSPEVAKKIAEALGFDWTRFYENDPKEATEKGLLQQKVQKRQRPGSVEPGRWCIMESCKNP